MWKFPHSNKKKGFTLIEVLIVITILAIVIVAAFFNYRGASRTFQFLGEYKSAVSVMRMARNYALTNKQVEVNGVMVTPKEYVVEISSNVVALKAKMADQTEEVVQSYTFDDYIFAVCDNLAIQCDGDAAQPKTLPVTLSYSLGNAEFKILDDQGAIIGKSVAVLFKEVTTSGTLKRYIIIYKVSGLAEESKYPLN